MLPHRNLTRNQRCRDPVKIGFLVSLSDAQQLSEGDTHSVLVTGALDVAS
jgi:hypothetical protein